MENNTYRGEPALPELPYYGPARVETIEDSRNPRRSSDRVVEPVSGTRYLSWVSRRVRAIFPHPRTGGLTLVFVNGASGWYPRENVRNFRACEVTR